MNVKRLQSALSDEREARLKELLGHPDYSTMSMLVGTINAIDRCLQAIKQEERISLKEHLNGTDLS